VNSRLAAGALVLAFAAAASAHPAGTSEIALTLRPDRTFVVAVTIDADALQAKLAALQQPIERLVDVRFDGVAASTQAAAPTVEAGMARVRLAGVVPPGAGDVSVRTKLVYGSYALTIQPIDAAPSAQWVQGFDASAPVPVGGPRSGGGDRRAIALVGGAFTLAGVFRYVGRRGPLDVRAPAR